MLTQIQCFLSICVLVSVSDVFSELVSAQNTGPENVLIGLNVQGGADDLTKEERGIRCASGARRSHLRKHDANQVAQYFINGGPLVGHSHFRGAQDLDTDLYDQNDPVGMPHVPHHIPHYGHTLHSMGVPHVPSMHPTHPYGQPHSLNYPYSSPYYPHNPYPNSDPNYLPNPPLSNWQSPQGGLVGSPLYQQPQSLGNGYYTTPSSTLRLPVLNPQDYSASNPIFSKKNNDESSDAPNVGAPLPNTSDEVQPAKPGKPIFEALIPHIPNQVHGFPQSYYSPTPYDAQHPVPTGYILRLIPHNPTVAPNPPSETNTDEPTVGASKSQPAEAQSDNEVYEDAQDETDDDPDNTDCTVTKREEPITRILT